MLPFRGGPRTLLATLTFCSLRAPLLRASWDILFHRGGKWEAVEASASRGRASTRPCASYFWVSWVQHLSSKGTDLAVPVTSIRLHSTAGGGPPQGQGLKLR